MAPRNESPKTRKLFNDGVVFIQKAQFKEAQESFEKCLKEKAYVKDASVAFELSKSKLDGAAVSVRQHQKRDLKRLKGGAGPPASLPRTSSGKPQRNKTRLMYLDGTLLRARSVHGPAVAAGNPAQSTEGNAPSAGPQTS